MPEKVKIEAETEGQPEKSSVLIWNQFGRQLGVAAVEGAGVQLTLYDALQDAQ